MRCHCVSIIETGRMRGTTRVAMRAAMERPEEPAR
jgi:hypothetical protein